MKREETSAFWQANSDKIAKLWKAGVRASAIAAELGCSRSKVLGRLNRMGLLGSVSDKDWRQRIADGTSVEGRATSARASAERWKNLSPAKQRIAIAKMRAGQRAWRQKLSVTERAAAAAQFSKRMRKFWAGLSPTERKKQIAHMQSARHRAAQ